LFRAIAAPILRDRGSENFGRERFKPRRDLLWAEPRLGPADHTQPPVAAAVEAAVLSTDDCFRANRDVHVNGATDVDAEKSRPRDADDRELMPVERNRLFEHVCVSAVLPLPEIVGEDSGARTSASIVVA